MTRDMAFPFRDHPVLIVPGIGGSGPHHWQSLWEQCHEHWQRVAQEDWNHPVREDWIAALDDAIVAAAHPPILVAHSLGCLLVAHWVSRSTSSVRAAFLVAPPDPEGPAFPSAAAGFSQIPLMRLPFPSLVVASTNDPFGPVAHARRCAERWGSQYVEIVSAGHLNADSGHGEWPSGFALLERFLSSIQ